ncbi:two-component regulator propeller domain-containing protein [Mangrovibacterium sp.]|uniref:hybrid sensor histidine kinase/response regulator transcription factor n=1 Tax=Mangrovibacterium sp. TaxID=1961364 RepID=UPI003567C2C0
MKNNFKTLLGRINPLRLNIGKVSGVREFIFSFSFIIVCLLLLTIKSNTLYAQSKLSFDHYSQEDGLPNNQIQCIFQDRKGWIWIGTNQGLSRFDGYSFTNFFSSPDDSTSLRGTLVRVIKEDKEGNLFIGTENGGLNIFDRSKETFTQPFDRIKEFSNREISVNDIAEDINGNFWLATDFNILILDTARQLSIIKPISNESANEFQGKLVRNLEFDTFGRLWIGTNNGVFIYDTASNTLERFELPFSQNQNKEIWEFYLDDEGFIWIGTYSAGLYIVNPETKAFEKIELEPSLPRTETVRAISKGVLGEYWIGTRGGLFKFSKTNGVTGFYRHNIQDISSLSNNSVLSIFHDKKGETWIGTREGLNLLAKNKQFFQNHPALPGNKRYLNSSTIYAFWEDSVGGIWIGTEDGGINIYNPKTRDYEYLMANGIPGKSISQNCIKSLLDDGKGNLWIGTFLGGVDVINVKTREVKNYRSKKEAGHTNWLSDNRVWDICMDRDNHIWVATSKGIDRFDETTSSFIHYPQLNGDEQILWIEPDSKGNLWMGSNDEVIKYNLDDKVVNRWFEHSRSMFVDSENRIWIATNDKGIAQYSEEKGALKYYNEKHGLANNQALCILEDNAKNLWISTSNGLSKFNPTRGLFQNFTSRDGLSNNQFCYGAALKADSGELLFGTFSGFISFNPDEIGEIDINVPLVFTDLKVFNKSVPIGDGKKAILKKSISETDHLIFDYLQNVFTLEFAALNYVNSENNLYSYKLVGFNNDWTEPSRSRTLTYTNLDPGNYTLLVKRIVDGSQQDDNQLELAITILPPFWKTTWFSVALILVVMFLIYAIIKFFVNREKIKSQLVIERANARKLHEVDMMKLKFFTNVSHDLRTPLTLILGPLNKLLQSESTDSETKANLKLIQRNAQNLDKLISQLLDFRKLQTGNLTLNLTQADIVAYIRNIVGSFNDYAIEKDIKLSFNTLKKRLFVSFDPDKIERILNNLLSNAFKFTEVNGIIAVNLSLVFDSNDEDFNAESSERQFIEITIKDTGKGISSENINRVFSRFFQSEEKDKSSGTGIGLALVKDLVKLHKGNIFVTSKEGKGTKFTIRIPYIGGLDDNSEPFVEDHESLKVAPIMQPMISSDSDTDINSKIMLIVDDNADVRQFIFSHFNRIYKIFQAANGEEGWKLALEVIPDIIISDVIMPGMDGYEFCKRLKNDERTSHIPVLLLTAMHSKEHELRGLTKGADDYITKPFDLSILQAKVENTISIRDSLKEKYTSTMVLEPTNVVIASPDEKFLKRVVDVVEANISDSEMDIENFAQKVGVSRMQLYRKLHALTDMTVKEFIRHIRLKRAIQLLDQQTLNISEIAYEVGFKDLSHFRKCFKREYGMSATDYLAKKQER